MLSKFLLFFVLGAVLISTLPSFIASYYNVAVGARQEASASVERLQQEAANANVSVEDFIKKHLESNDSIFIASGRIFEKSYKRYMIYNKIAESICNSTDCSINMNSFKGFVSTFNAEVASETMKTHEFKIVFNELTRELLIYYAVILLALTAVMQMFK